MFQYFPTNYVWNLSVNIAMNCGAQIGEIDRVCAPLVEVSKQGDDEGTEQFFWSWCEMADKLARYAAEDRAAGHNLSAGAKYARASTYLMVAERMQARDFGPRAEAYRKMKDTFALAVECGEENCEFVDIPFEGSSYPALFVRAEAVDGPARTMVFCNGLDSMKEMVYRAGMPAELARRGISTLIVDQPGTGGALRDQELHGFHDSERWASAAVDYLLTRPDVDPERIGIMGWSLGGYYAPRAAAFEKRFSLCAVWGANYNWGELQKRRLAREGDRPVPHYWSHVQWVFGKDSLEEFMEWAPCMTLEGVVEQITVPFLVTHGESDRQIPMEFALPQYELATASPKREWHLFSNDLGGSSHASADNEAIATSFVSDWINDNL